MISTCYSHQTSHKRSFSYVWWRKNPANRTGKAGQGVAVHASVRESERARDASCASLRTDPLSTHTTAVNGAAHSKDFAARPKMSSLQTSGLPLWRWGDIHSGNSKTRGFCKAQMYLPARPDFFHLQPAPQLAMDTTTQTMVCGAICHGASYHCASPQPVCMHTVTHILSVSQHTIVCRCTMATRTDRMPTPASPTSHE